MNNHPDGWHELYLGVSVYVLAGEPLFVCDRSRRNSHAILHHINKQFPDKVRGLDNWRFYMHEPEGVAWIKPVPNLCKCGQIATYKWAPYDADKRADLCQSCYDRQCSQCKHAFDGRPIRDGLYSLCCRFCFALLGYFRMTREQIEKISDDWKRM